MERVEDCDFKHSQSAFLFVFGPNLRSDLIGSKPYIRTIKNPFDQLLADIQVNRNVSRKVQLAVYLFKEAEHLELSIRAHVETDKAVTAAREELAEQRI
jgi:hypothetical protein